MNSLDVFLLLLGYSFFFLGYFFWRQGYATFRRSRLHYSLAILLIIVVIGAVVTLVRVTTPIAKNYCSPLMQQTVMKRASPVLTSMLPSVTYPSTTVIIYGKNFGWLQDKNDATNKLMLDEKPISTSFWSDTKIYLTLPLDIPLGTHEVNIQSDYLYAGKLFPSKSNVLLLNVISRDDGWDQRDDEYFRQINQLPLEDRELYD